MPFLNKLFKRRIQAEIENEEDARDRVENARDRLAPEANIFRALAQKAECNIHKYDLQEQLAALAEHFGKILDASDTPLMFPEDLEDDSPEAKRYHQLLYLLHTATIEEKLLTKESTYGLVPKGGYPPLTDFLNDDKTMSCLCGLIFYRRKTYLFKLQQVIMGVLVAGIMIVGPFLILTTNARLLFKDTLKDVDLSTWSGIKHQLFCVGGTTDQQLVTILATLFLLMNFEIVRNYMKMEIASLYRLRALPAFWFWSRLGQFTNMVCCVTSVFCLPFVFANELFAKDIVFDSLALLFIFTLDDLSSDAMKGLEFSEDDFKNEYVSMLSSLSLCPVELKDVVNLNAEKPDDIWRIKLDDLGLLKFSGERCLCRIEAKGPSEKDPLVMKDVEEKGLRLADMDLPTKYWYRTTPGEESEMPREYFVKAPVVKIWYFWYAIVLVGEVIVPLAFFFFSDPCVK